jgi:hypothetical protein
MSYKYSKKEIQDHCIKREEHEKETDKYLNNFVNKYFPDRYIVNRTTNQWGRYDCLIYDTIKHTYCRVECKTRNFNINQYNKYKEEGFCLSLSKLDNADVIIYIIPISNEILQIRTNTIKQLINESKLKVVKKQVNRYQYTTYKEKHEEQLILIPYQYFKVYKM